ncbi:hypothetical protein FQN55_003056 [Onygenales sp. PD_40]|nr:hypothetical protein FQN55_003056 [Onygenales sp. PD_40]KAK2781130.1 hypothetical protein FQN52_001777 [Onygenales sp. PD_12]
MGRRKIEIKAIKDDRNRSVTFLKRKGGLFKKAHELSVLCSVDVAVIIFGNNKKLYEFSSGDITDTLNRYQYYAGQAHEHKGPADFAGKGNLDDEEDEELSGADDLPPQNNNMIPPQLQNQPTFQHINHHPSASPPMHNGVAFHTRHGTPQPGISRPSSRNNLQRMGSGLVPQQHHHATPPPPQNGFTYMPNPPMYNHQQNPNMQQPPPRPGQFPYPPPMPQHQPPPQQQHPPHPQHHPHHQQQHPPPPAPPQHQQPQHQPQHQPQPQPQPQHQHQHPQPHHQSLPASQQNYLNEQPRRQSGPPAFPQQERQSQPQERSPPQQHQQQPPAKPDQNLTSPPQKPPQAKSRSIYTPIDDRGSFLAQHFIYAAQSDSPKSESTSKTEHDKPESTNHSLPPPPPPIKAATHPQPHRTQSLSSVPDITPISRANSLQTGAKRPVLKVQIPSEHSEAGSATGDSSPRDSTGNTAATPARGSSDTGHSGVVLPPPSPSASALLSAGAQGPPNPFARPPPPAVTSSHNNNIDTPISALPSRFVSDTLLPSPSSFYPEWGFGRSGPDSNVLPSPLTFPTPIVQNGPSFSKDADDSDKKRKSPEGGSSATEPVAAGKRLKVE